MFVHKFNQSINQLNFSGANVPSEAKLCGATAASVFNSTNDEAVLQHQWAVGCAVVYGGVLDKSKRCLEMFLEGKN